MTQTVLVVGASGSGKTTLIERVVPALRARGLSVGTMKHAHHGFEPDKEGSDSARHAAAGASPVVVVGPEGYALHGSAPVSGRVPGVDALIQRHFAVADIVLAEGFSSAGGQKLLVHRRGTTPKPLTHPEEVFLAVTDEPLGYPSETAPDDVEAVAETLAAMVDQSEAPDVVLTVDGRPIPITEFVRRTLSGAVVGMVGELKGVSTDPREITLVIRRG
ncbi:MAG: molybdopterin-guanine dinucleotide biosynthesis protein B [Acidimicrobiia bacterium]|nr:molybdopterin-guanine dinucleotide biosynthesis protein B [Acidimicrobiia bacterium]